jgi:hypothetical protein
VGDVLAMVSPPNRPLIVTGEGEEPLQDALAMLVADSAMRREVGAANRVVAERDFQENGMIAAYAALYEQVLGRTGNLGRYG